MKNLLILLGILLSSPFVVAQHLAINGNVAIADNSPEGTRVVVTKNGNKLDEQVLNKKGHFDLKLAFDADYKISFEKTGYITKIVSINTEVPEESIENNPDFPPVKLIINLLPSVEKIDLSIFDQPIAILTYQAELDDFTFDKSYSDKIKDRIAQTEQAVKKQLAARDAAAIEQEQLDPGSKYEARQQRGETKNCGSSGTSKTGRSPKECRTSKRTNLPTTARCGRRFIQPGRVAGG